MNSKRSRIDDEDEDYFSENQEGPLGFSVKSKQAHNFIVHIDKEIKGAAYYSKVFDMMLQAGEHDLIDFFISSPGGDVEGLNVLLEGMKLTDAHIRAILVGSCHSAASIFAMNCPEVIVCDRATMLVHNVRTGFGGKMADLEAFTTFSKKTSSKLIQETYKYFLSDEEIKEVLAGRELWLDADQIRERLERREEMRELEKQTEPEEKPVSKSTKKKAKAKDATPVTGTS